MRKHRFVRGGAVVVAGLALFTAGCGDNAGDPVGYVPEGQAGGAVLITYAVPANADSSVVFLLANVYSPPPANGYRFYVKPGDLGYRPACDAPITPVTTFTSGWSAYSSIIEGFDPAVDNAVQARGARDGVESASAPLTNESFIVRGPAKDLVRYQPFTLTSPGDSAEVTTTPTLTWPAVPGATGYLVTLFTTNGVSSYFAFTSATTHTVGAGPGTILHDIPLVPGGLYNWNVQAIDYGSRVFATSDIRALLVEAPTP